MCACQEQGPRPTGPYVRDSAGVRIVEHRGRSNATTDWLVGETPILDIGSIEDQSEYQLYEVRDALRLDDGRIVVASEGTNDLRFFSSEGEFLRSAGGAGEGPGEFRALVGLQLLSADSLLAFDQRLGRVSHFDSFGTFIRSTNFATLRDTPINGFIGRFADGSTVVTAARAVRQQSVDANVVVRDPVLFLRVLEATVDTLASFPGRAKTFAQLDGMQVILNVPLGRSTLHAFRGDRLFVGDNDAYEIKALRPDGSVALIVRMAHHPLPVAEDDYRRFIETELLAEVDDEDLRTTLERMFANISLPETVPAFGWLIADTDGNLWVREHARPDDDANRWTVFGGDGAMIARVSLEPRFLPLQIGRDFLLGRWIDELGVEHVQMYSLGK
jgi:hypothetical protein